MGNKKENLSILQDIETMLNFNPYKRPSLKNLSQKYKSLHK